MLVNGNFGDFPVFIAVSGGFNINYCVQNVKYLINLLLNYINLLKILNVKIKRFKKILFLYVQN